MPERDRGSPFKVMGPFAGLNTWQQPREISQKHAVRAHNVLLDKGTIQVRPPLEQDFRFSGYPPGKVYNGVDWYPPALTGVLHDLVNVLHIDDMLFSLSGSISGVQRRQGSFVFARGYLYYLDGRNVYRFNGTDWVIAGLRMGVMVGPWASFLNDLALVTVAPGAVRWGVFTLPWTGNPVFPGAAALEWNTTYEFNFTVFDVVNNFESNGGIDGAPSINMMYSTGPDPGGAPSSPYLMYNSAGIFVRAYVRNVTAGDSFFVCYTQGTGVGLGLPSQDFTGPKIGNSESGPFLPYLNGVPEFATVGFYYKNRMFYNDVRNPNLLRYSADGFPEHIDMDADFETLTDDGGQITGMAELTGQLVVFKERSAWILSGVIFAPTNASVNLGVPRSSITQSHEVYQTKVTVGCANNAGGNGAFLCKGHVYYNGIDGLYRFDGLIEENIANIIQPTWRLFVGSGTFGANQAVTFSHDTDRGILYMVNLSIDEERVPILAFHYERTESPVWTTIGPDDPADNPTCIIPVIGTQDPNAPLEPDGSGAELRPTGLAFAVGTGAVRVLVMNDRRIDLPMPAFEYESGRIVLVEGLDKHFYWTRWFHNSEPADIYDRRIEVGFRTQPRNVEEFKSIDLVGSIVGFQKVAEVGSDISVLARKPATGDPRWHPNHSIIGFGLDAEEIGQ